MRHSLAVAMFIVIIFSMSTAQHYGPPGVTPEGDTIWPVAKIVATTPSLNGGSRKEVAIGDRHYADDRGAVYIYEFPFTSDTCIPSLVFEDDFSDSNIDDKWYRIVYNSAGGSETDPPPYLDFSSGSSYAPSMVPNGDSWCANACYTKIEFDYTNGMIIEFDMNVTTHGTLWNGGVVGLSRGPAVISRPRADSAFIDDTRCDPNNIAGIGYSGVVDTHYAGFYVWLLRPDSSLETYHLFDGYAHIGSWNHYKIYIRPDLRVEFYVNDTLLYTSTSNICTTFSPVPLVAGGRNVPGPIWMDNFKIYMCQTTSDTCLPDGLIAYYPFNGNANDESGHGHNGVVYGATLTEDMCGRADSAFRFDGVNDSINCGNSADLQTEEVSVTCWIKPYDLTRHSPTIVSKSTKSLDGYAILTLGNELQWEISHSGAWNSILYDSIETNKWYFVGMTYKDGVLKAYINGVLYDSLLFEMSPPISKPLIIGHGYNTLGGWGTKGFNGVIDNVRIYNRALTDGEIQIIYECEYCKTNVSDKGIISKPIQLSISVIPNPFNASCRITIDASQSGNAIIYDILGKRVGKFKFTKGCNEFVWHAENNPSGLYIIHAIAGQAGKSKRIILIK